jgi:hypothetical protein
MLNDRGASPLFIGTMTSWFRTFAGYLRQTPIGIGLLQTCGKKISIGIGLLQTCGKQISIGNGLLQTCGREILMGIAIAGLRTPPIPLRASHFLVHLPRIDQK